MKIEYWSQWSLQIKFGELNSSLFDELCKSMNSKHEVNIFYTTLRWLSKVNIVNRVKI